jgi:hypothetical protein
MMNNTYITRWGKLHLIFKYGISSRRVVSFTVAESQEWKLGVAVLACHTSALMAQPKYPKTKWGLRLVVKWVFSARQWDISIIYLNSNFSVSSMTTNFMLG